MSRRVSTTKNLQEIYSHACKNTLLGFKHLNFSLYIWMFPQLGWSDLLMSHQFILLSAEWCSLKQYTNLLSWKLTFRLYIIIHRITALPKNNRHQKPQPAFFRHSYKHVDSYKTNKTTQSGFYKCSPKESFTMDKEKIGCKALFHLTTLSDITRWSFSKKDLKLQQPAPCTRTVFTNSCWPNTLSYFAS